MFAYHDAVIAALSFGVCAVVLVLVKLFPTHLAKDKQLRAVQAMHIRSTPRLGGLGIFISLVATLPFAPVVIGEPYRDFIVATGVLFFVGLAEDLGWSVRPRWRFLAAVVSSLLVMFFLGVWMPRVGIPELDALMAFWWIGVPITVLVTVGIANGFNLIDGVNGLAALTAITAAAALAMIADAADYPTMVHLTTMLIAGILGFFIWNYPFGRIFLGDAGAYTLGFVLSWFAISIMLNVPTTSPWALLLTLFWPVADTLLAIWRRMHRKAPTMAPDRLHVHQLVMRTLEIHVLGRGRRQIANPLTTVILAPFVIAPPTVGVLLWDNNQGAFLAVVIFAGLFFGSYTVSFNMLSRKLRHEN
jgi:UDP-GlcNAc:undecaprenyl-phosphate/decaprenyl-phosphate GlcNAc-1-phosphate transferase